jgi:hypothetical protein
VKLCEVIAEACPVNIMTAELKFEAGTIAPESPKKFPLLWKKEIIALIRVVRERKPSFDSGNQYREALNVICGAGIDHAKDLNAEIMSLALKITKLPAELEEEVVKWLPNAKKSFDRSLKSWTEKEGGSHE